MKIYCDSSTREACIVPEGHDPIIVPYKWEVTNNVGEYLAVIYALEWAEEKAIEEVRLCTDSLLVVNQVRGKWKCRAGHLIPYRDTARKLALNFNWLGRRGISLRHIPRVENLAGKVLEP